MQVSPKQCLICGDQHFVSWNRAGCQSLAQICRYSYSLFLCWAMLFFWLLFGTSGISSSRSSSGSSLRRYKRAPASNFSQHTFASLWNHTIRALTTHMWRPNFFNHTFDERLRLFVDSSSLAHGAVLFQGDRMVAIWSVLNPQGYQSSNFSELDGLCKAIQGFKIYPFDRPFTVYANNRSVLSMFNAYNHSPFVLPHPAELQDQFLHPLPKSNLSRVKPIILPTFCLDTSTLRSGIHPHKSHQSF